MSDLDHITDADRLRWARRSLDRQDAQIEELTAVLRALTDAWDVVSNDPDGDFDCAGGINQESLWDAAKAILQRDESPEPMHVWSND